MYILEEKNIFPLYIQSMYANAPIIPLPILMLVCTWHEEFTPQNLGGSFGIAPIPLYI